MSCGLTGFRACETAVMTHGGMGYAREYHVAMRHHCRLASTKPGLGGAIFSGVGVGAGLFATVIRGRCAQHHQLRCFELDPALGERVLDRLVLADRAAEHEMEER